MPTSQGFRGLRVYQLAFKLAMEIFARVKEVPTRREVFPHRPNPQVFQKCGNKHW